MLPFIAKLINKIVYWARLCYYYIYLAMAKAYLSIKWSPWNPWSIAKLNMAWRRYINTPMYEERTKLPRDFHTDKNFENFAEQSFVNNGEAELFIRLFTGKEKLKVLFMPFSCGNKYRMPFYKIAEWLFGGYSK